MTASASTLTGCDLKSPKLDIKPKTVSVNGTAIPRGDIARETQNHGAATPIAAWKMAARALVIRELLRQEAASRGIHAVPLDDGEGRSETPDEAAMRALLDTEVRVPTADEDTCRRYYAQNSAKFCSAPLYAARHILIAAAPDDFTMRDAARLEAEQICAILAEKPEAFDRLALAHSACPSAKVGGNLGQIGPGQTVAEFEKALGLMKVDQPPAIIETRYGLHVVALDRKVEGEAVPFDFVREQIGDYLDETVRRRAMHQYITILAERAEITGLDFFAPEPPANQQPATSSPRHQ